MYYASTTAPGGVPSKSEMKDLYSSSKSNGSFSGGMNTMSTATVKTSGPRFRSSRRSNNHHNSSSNSNTNNNKINHPPNPLQQAIFRGCVECIRVLIDTTPYYSVDDPIDPLDSLIRPIHLAARQGHLHVLRFLLSSGATLDLCDIHGLSALHHAVIGGQLRGVRWLLRHGIRTNIVDSRGRTALDIAVENEDYEIVNLLSKHSSAQTNPINHSSNNHQNYLCTYHPIVPPLHSGKKHSSRNSKKLNNRKELLQPELQVQDSGNSSLATTASSSSPSCSCSESDDTIAYATSVTASASGIDIGGKNSKRSSSSNVSFYLHPPNSNRTESFYLHPPGHAQDQISCTDSSLTTSTLAGGSSSSSSIVADAESSTSTLTITFAEEESPVPPEMPPVCSNPSSAKSEFLGNTTANTGDKKTPPPTPPPKVVRIQSSPIIRKDSAPSIPVPPPPPPPMPDFNKLKLPLRAVLSEPAPRTGNRNGSSPTRKDFPPTPPEENEYEDIIDQVAQIEIKNQCISPQPTPSEAQAATMNQLKKSLSGIMGGPGGKSPHARVKFIPPSFPDPPLVDQLIKPSEYLRSLQQQQGGANNGNANKGKMGKPKYGVLNSNSPTKAPCNPLIEETIKKLLNGNSSSPEPMNNHNNNPPPKIQLVD